MNLPPLARLRHGLPWGVFACAVLAAFLRTITAPSQPYTQRLSREQRAELAVEGASLEDAWRHNGALLYPGDRWSADDDFHNQEGRWARSVAGAFRVPVGDMLHAIDEGLHAALRNGTPRRSTASPCKPRPFYD